MPPVIPKKKGLAPSPDAPSPIEPSSEMVNANLVHLLLPHGFACGAQNGRYGTGWGPVTCTACVPAA